MSFARRERMALGSNSYTRRWRTVLERLYLHPWRSRPQPEEHLSRYPARPAHGGDGRLRIGKIFAGLRHDLRGGPAPLCRIALGLRASILGADGEARRR